MTRYKHWDVVEVMPEGWAIDNTAGSPLGGHVFITNGKSLLDGQKRALLKIKPLEPRAVTVGGVSEEIEVEVEPKKKAQVIDENYVRTVNDLARAKFKERMLNDIMVDLMICEIEGWNKAEYISELQSLIGSIRSAKS